MKLKGVLLDSATYLCRGDEFRGSVIKTMELSQEAGQMSYVPIIVLTMEDGSIWELNKAQILGATFDR